MDVFLINYLRSGRAWVLVGSGPSIEMGYPSWEKLALAAIKLVKIEGPETNLIQLESALKRRDFPTVFENAKSIVGGQRLLQYLQEQLRPTQCEKNVYEIIARWPVPVYLTTNYDDEVQTNLASLREAYNLYSNSEDHFSYLMPDLNGAIFKLHGDLRSEDGLILTSSQYKAIANDEYWGYWRTKMTSVFQMNRIVVIGHSLSDTHIKHILEAAKQGAGVNQPICWIAPDTNQKECREYLEKYRIRVISYDNRDGEHRNLLRLIEHINNFIPSRVSIHIQQQIANVSRSPLEINAAAPGFFIFNKLAVQSNFDAKREDIVVATIQSILPKLKQIGEFTLQSALELAGWPPNLPLESVFADRVIKKAIKQNILVQTRNNTLRVGDEAEKISLEKRVNFEHVRDRFKKALEIRIKNSYPSLSDAEVSQIATDIEASLVGYFREGGLSLATTLFSSKYPTKSNVIPTSIIEFIQEASARYNDQLMRQAFCTVSVDAFAHSSSAERDYLGRIAQGFFAFHALGAFGVVAAERLKEAEKTVWLIDSSAQIPALALASPTQMVFNTCFTRLHSMGIRFFTTKKLFNETFEHLWYADTVIKENGSSLHNLIAASTGQAPFRKSNVFLEGFIQWIGSGNPNDWSSYLYQIINNTKLTEKDVEAALKRLGIEVVDFDAWPGFVITDYGISQKIKGKIVSKLMEYRQLLPATRDFDQMADPEEKAEPESEALVVVKKERQGQYYILSDKKGEHSPSWFISDTSMLNLVEHGPRITWQTEAFLRFSSTVFPNIDIKSAECAFETLLPGLTQAGVSLLDDKIIESVFGCIIDQTLVSINEQRKLYEETLSIKYGESPEAIMARIPRMFQPLAAVQLANEMAQVALQHKKQAEIVKVSAIQRAKKAEEELSKVEKYRKKIREKELQRLRKSRRQKSRSNKRR